MKFGLIGIAVACALFCSAWLYGTKPAPTWKPDADSPRQFATDKPELDLDPADVYLRPELVWSMEKILWPEANMTIKEGPVDGYYAALTQAQIDDLLNFHRMRRELFPYISDSFDCDDFGLEFYYLARVWAVRHWHGQGPPPAVGAAFIHVDGLYPLFSKPYWGTFNHVINVVLRDDGQWFFIEPQNQRIVPIEEAIYAGDIEVFKILI